jgi:hypothetical protein
MAGAYSCLKNQRTPGTDAGNDTTEAAGEGHGRPSPAPFIIHSLAVAAILTFSCSAWAAGQLDGTTGGTRADLTGRETAPPAVASSTSTQVPQQQQPQRLNNQKMKFAGAAVGAPPFHQLQQDTPATPQELAAARGLESMLVNLMIDEMRKSVPENDLIPTSQGERIFRQMLDQQYADKISESSMLGIADLVVAQMHGKR